VAEHRSDFLVLPGRHLLEHVELIGDQLQAEGAPPEQPERGGDLLALEQSGCFLCLD
jgi:hypothetical protein